MAQDAWEEIRVEADELLWWGFMLSRAKDEEEEMALVLKHKRQEKEVIENEKKEYMRKNTENVTRLCGKNLSGLVEGDDDCELRAKIEEYKDKLDELEVAYLSKKNEVEYAEKELNKRKETVDSCNVERITSRGKIEMMLGLLDTDKRVEITDIQGLTALEIMKELDTGKKLRFCIGTGIDREVYESIQRIAEFVGIGEASLGVLYELSEGVFTKVSQEESLALGFQM